jgi:cytidylate kinase
MATLNSLPHPSLTITIDGPAGSGKTSLASALAGKLRLRFLSSGKIFRSLAFVYMSGTFPDTSKLCSVLTLHKPLAGSREYVVRVGGKMLGSELRTPEVTEMAAKLAGTKVVQDCVRDLVRKTPSEGLIIEGRNAGTTFFPEAELKVFVTASLSQRGQRRYQQLQSWGNNKLTLEEVEMGMCERDTLDSTRKEDPLRVPEDAFLLDNSFLSMEKSVETVVSELKRRNLI